MLSFLIRADFSAVTCTPVSLPSSMATSPVTQFSSSTTVSLRLAQVGVMGQKMKPVQDSLSPNLCTGLIKGLPLISQLLQTPSITT